MSKPASKKVAEAIVPSALKHNITVISYFRTFVAVIMGAAVGILGVDGWWGFIPFFITQLLCAVAMILKGAAQPRKYFGSWFNLLTVNMFSSSSVLSYILMWMIFYNLTVVFT